MPPSDNLTHLRLGEDSTVEFKRVVVRQGRILAPDRNHLADELAAMANIADATCLLSVDATTCDVLGIPLAALDAAEAWVREIQNDSIQPPILA